MPRSIARQLPIFIFLLLHGAARAAYPPPPAPSPGPSAQAPATSASVQAQETEVRRVCDAMRPHVGNKGKIRAIGVVVEKEVNAWADHKGTVTFTTGILEFLKTPDEIAVICGHEMSHITAGHIKRSIGTQILGTLIGGELLGDLAGSALVNKQSRSHEREADERGLFAMWRAGYNPMTAVDVWQRMMDKYGGKNIPYFSSHPSNKERLQNMKVIMVRNCLKDESQLFCDRILNDADYKAAYEKFK